MARTDTLTNYLSDVAEAIKTKKGDDTPILASEFDTEIANLPSGGGGHDWTAIGYSSEPSFIQNGYNYAVQIKNNWTNETSLADKFRDDKVITFMPMVNTSNCTNFNSMFRNCPVLRTIPQLDTSNGTDFGAFLGTSKGVESVAELDLSKATVISAFFNGNAALKDFGGLKNLGQAYDTSVAANYDSYCLNLSGAQVLTKQSALNIFNNLYDIASKGCNTQKITLHSNVKSLLTAEEIAIATNKGWTIA